MDTLDRLEGAIKSIIEAYLVLREENEHLSGERVLIEAELSQARETIRSLQSELKRFAAADDQRRDFKSRKEELETYIKSVIDKIDRYSGSDSMDAVTDA
jgi:chromosome segregation ATPase